MANVEKHGYKLLDKVETQLERHGSSSRLPAAEYRQRIMPRNATWTRYQITAHVKTHSLARKTTQNTVLAGITQLNSVNCRLQTSSCNIMQYPAVRPHVRGFARHSSSQRRRCPVALVSAHTGTVWAPWSYVYPTRCRTPAAM